MGSDGVEMGVTFVRVVREFLFEKVNLFLRRNQLWKNRGEGPLGPENSIGKGPEVGLF